MGADAYITIQRVKYGEYIVTGNPLKYPSFVVTEPVAIDYACFYRVGGRDEHNGWTNLRVRDEWPFDDMQLVVIPNVVAVAVFPRVMISNYLQMVWGDYPATEKYPAWKEGPGGQQLDKLRGVWDQIVPGRWVITDYYVSGNGSDAPFFRLHGVPDGCGLGAKVEWCLWT